MTLHPALRSPALAAILGDDPALRTTLARAARIAPTRTPVLVTGESGTGKELLARALHELGPDPDGPFVAVNCGALSRELAESELFGHERGAFTGAAGRRAGWFEEAAGGTLVLDEVGELPLDLQPKLLRVLETGRLRRVGGGEIPVRVRVVAATLRDLRREISRGTFRLDLFHRLAGFELTLPPLRRRLTDIPRLARHFLDELRPELGHRELTPAALARLAAHDWPGNVRELRNVLRRAAVLAGGLADDGANGITGDGVIDVHDLDRELRPLDLDRVLEPGPAARAADAASPPELRPACYVPTPYGQAPYTSEGPTGGLPSVGAASHGDLLPLAGRSFSDLEKSIFAWALRRHGGSRRRAAHALGISRSTFCDRVKRLGISP